MKINLYVLMSLLTAATPAFAEDDTPGRSVTRNIRIEGGEWQERDEVEIYDSRDGTFHTMTVYRKLDKKKPKTEAATSPGTQSPVAPESTKR